MSEPPSREPTRRPRIRFRLAAAGRGSERGIDIDEAFLLEDWLAITRTLAADTLARDIRDAIEAGGAAPILLTEDTRLALCDVLAEPDAAGFAGLTSLRDAYCGPAFES